MQIPTKAQCYNMIFEMKMMDHIVVHSLQVCRVATLLTEHLIKQHCRLNFDLIQSAALLHDITKTRSFKTREDHALTGGEYLADRGYPEVGDLVRQHVVLDTYSVAATIREVEVLNYADKRVLHDEIVVLDKRLDYILERYAETPSHRERINVLWRKTREMENKLFKDLSFAPDDLTRLLSHNGYIAELQKYQKLADQI
ncbi:MAG: HDIG domain-containing protein [Proteobacteria bacterium]|nr:HDIG domain-containing protein [Pseudomonadota bacterium]